MNILQSLADQAKKKKDQLVQDITRSAPVQRVSQVVDQVNPLDNGRTYQNRTPTNQRSAAQQLAHNGVSNFAGGIAKPLIRSSMALNQGIGNAEIGVAHALGQRRDLQTLNGQQYANQSIGRNLNRAVDYTGTKRQIIGDAVSNVANVGMPGSSKLVTGVAGKLLPKAIPQLVPKVLSHAAVGGISGAAGNIGGYVASNQPVTAKGVLQTAGTGAKYGAAFGGAMPLAPIAARAGVKGAKVADKQLRMAQVRAGTQEAITSQQKQLQRQIESHQKQIDKLPINNHRAAEVLQRKVDAKQGQIAQLEASRPKQNVVQRTSDRLLSVQPGNSMKPINGDVPPTTPAVTLPDAAAPAPQMPASKLPRLEGEASLPNGSKQTRFTGTTIPKSAEVSDPVKAQVDASYVPGKNNETVASVQDQVRQQGLKPALNETLNSLNTERGTAHRDTLAKAIEIAKQHDALGTPEDQAIAAHLYDLVGEHGSAKGQGAQILATIARSSPAGLRNKAFRDLKNSGVNVTPELQAEIQSHIDAISSLPEGPTRDMAIAVLQKTVAKHIPQGKMDNVISVWKAGLLSGVKTQGGNTESNAAFAGLKKISDVPASAADRLIALKTGKRSVGLTGKGYGQGFKQGLGTAKGTLKTGIDARDIGGSKYEQHAEINFGNPVIQAVFGNPANLVFRGMKAADQPFYYGAFKNSLYDQAKAEGRTAGLRGKALSEHMDNTVKNPTEAMANIAEHDANRAVLNFDTIGSKAISAVHTGIDNFPGISPVGKQTAHAVINILAPFVRVPSAFISRAVDFTPLGIPKTVIGQASRGKFDQRALSQAIGEGATGTGIIALGMALTHGNALSGDYPKNDPKEAQRWKAEGITPNSVKIGNKWVSLNYLGPVGLLFNAGRNMVQAKGQGALAQAGAGIAGLGQGLLGQSFLQGFSGFSDAIQNPERNLKSFVNSQASSVIPSFSNDIATATDKFQRQADTVGQSIKNRIPGLRQTNPIKQDVYGNNLQRQSGALDVANPLKPSNNLAKNNPVLSEVNRLHTIDPNNSDLQVTPSPVGKTITIPAASKGEKSTEIALNTKQRYDLQKTTGNLIQSKWGELIKTPEYQALDDAGKAKALTNLRTDASTLAAREYVTKNNLGTYSKAASKSVQALAGGDLSSYASASDGSGMTIAKGIDPHSIKVLKEYNSLDAAARKSKAYKENDYDYKVAQAKYDNNLANGSLSKAQQISQKDAVRRAKVGSSFSKDTRDLYGLSKDEVYDLITQDENGKKIATDLLSYGDALQKATGTQNKFRTKKGAESFQTANRGGSTGGGRKKSLSALLAEFKTPYSDQIQNRSKAASLARNAGLAKKS